MILLFAYLVGYAISYPTVFMAILKDFGYKPYVNPFNNPAGVPLN